MKNKGQDHGPANIVAVQPGAGNLLPVQPSGNSYPYDQVGQPLVSQNTAAQGCYFFNVLDHYLEFLLFL